MPKDKLLHFIAGLAIALASIYLGLWASVAIVFITGLFKETWDWFNPPHTVDILDLVATVMGGIPVWVAACLFNR